MSLATAAQKLAYTAPQQQQKKPGLIKRVAKGVALGGLAVGAASAIRSGAMKKGLSNVAAKLKPKTAELDAPVTAFAKAATAVAESIDFDSFWKSEPRGRGPVVATHGAQLEPHQRHGGELLGKTLDYAKAQGHGEAVLGKIKDEHAHTSALQAIQATARVN